ncbi:phage terminase small subunit [Novosphingobium sp. KA1]|uniref:phage terminase small subunit n=1 Tax=Novosphingobium sp. (strain KA1) TaxID=164608 RepID=UPI001A8C9EB3|nr:phage terminase small subunit [Novosphingobium sp. KA1]QSR17491.1 terminase [Novosphingobium sp. KA1]
MSLARRKRDRILAAQTVTAAAAPVRGVAVALAAAPPSAAGANSASPAERAAKEMALRLTHDIRRLKAISSIDRKIAAKREMLPEYAAWIEGLVAADAGVGTGVAATVLPTCMVWLIDIGQFSQALDLVPFILRHKVAMPARYHRDAAAVVTENIANAADKAHKLDTPFPLEILERVAELTADCDMHDEIRAKLLKALGIEELREAEGMEAGPNARLHLTIARNTLREALRLNDRAGVKDRIKRADKLIAANLAAFPPTTNNEPGGPAA